jgi:hypothetical protein
MATTHSTAKAHSGRNRPSKPRAAAPRRRQPTKQERENPETSERGTAIRIRGQLREFLDAEQGFLLKAESLLLCIAKSMDDSTHPSTGPYYPDAVELACELLRRRAANIDQLLLDGRLPHREDGVTRPIL